MSAIPSLPQTRPLATTYGGDMVNDGAIDKPDSQCPADVWNQIRVDVAQAQSTIPRAIVRVTNNGTTAAVAAVYGVASGITATRTGLGTVDIDVSGAAFVAYDAMAGTCGGVAGAADAKLATTPGTVIHVKTSVAGALADCDFMAQIF